jgi:Ca2+-binding EF-hand superfamily protein
VTDSIHELMGNTSAVGSKTSQAHINRIFETMDLNKDGKVTLDEFVTYCTTQEGVRQSLMVFVY